MFGSCIIHILYTGVLKLRKWYRRQKINVFCMYHAGIIFQWWFFHCEYKVHVPTKVEALSVTIFNISFLLVMATSSLVMGCQRCREAYRLCLIYRLYQVTEKCGLWSTDRTYSAQTLLSTYQKTCCRSAEKNHNMKVQNLSIRMFVLVSVFVITLTSQIKILCYLITKSLCLFYFQNLLNFEPFRSTKFMTLGLFLLRSTLLEYTVSSALFVLSRLSN